MNQETLFTLPHQKPQQKPEPLTHAPTIAQVHGLPLFGGSQEVINDPRVPETNIYKEILNQPINQ